MKPSELLRKAQKQHNELELTLEKINLKLRAIFTDVDGVDVSVMYFTSGGWCLARGMMNFSLTYENLDAICKMSCDDALDFINREMYAESTEG
jgi:hypothetical protein